MISVLKLIQSVSNHILSKKLLKPNQLILVTISGGQDSVCLFLILLHLKLQWKWKIHIIYCHHLWQTDSFFIMKQLIKFTNLFKITFYLAITANNIFNEKEARNWRYKCFYRIGIFRTISYRKETTCLDYKTKVNKILYKIGEKSITSAITDINLSYYQRNFEYCINWLVWGPTKRAPAELRSSHASALKKDKQKIYFMSPVLFCVTKPVKKCLVCRILEPSKQKKNRVIKIIFFAVTQGSKYKKVKKQNLFYFEVFGFISKGQPCFVPIAKKTKVGTNWSNIVSKENLIQGFLVQQKIFLFQQKHKILSEQSIWLVWKPTIPRSKDWNCQIYSNLIYGFLVPSKEEQKTQNKKDRSINASLVTGHTSNDKIETLLFNMIRGCGLKGIYSLRWKRYIKENKYKKIFLSDFFIFRSHCCFSIRNYKSNNSYRTAIFFRYFKLL